MTGGTLSGGVVIALAATLWLAYLVPTWLRRRDYMNAERNAVRLQQTLRILAETAEAPEEVRVEPTARDVARQQRLLKKVQAKAAASARAHAASEARAIARAEAAHDDQLPPLGATDVAEAEVAVQRADVRSAPSRAERERTFMHAVRRTRLATTGAVAASVIGIVFGVHSLLISGSWWLLAASAVLFVCAVAVLRRLAQQIAAHRAARHGRMPVVRQNPDLYDHAEHAEHADPAPVAEPAADEADGWEPQPLPKPMYQSPGSRAAAAMASLDAAVALRRAAARAELEERAARLSAAQVPTLPVREQPQEPERQVAEQPAQAPRPASRYSSMGMLGDVESEHIDLDEALRRRRAAG